MTFWSSEGRAKLAWAMPSRDRIDAKHNNGECSIIINKNGTER